MPRCSITESCGSSNKVYRPDYCSNKDDFFNNNLNHWISSSIALCALGVLVANNDRSIKHCQGVQSLNLAEAQIKFLDLIIVQTPR